MTAPNPPAPPEPQPNPEDTNANKPKASTPPTPSTTPPISQQAEGSDIAMAAGQGAVASIVKADFKSPLGILLMASLIPYLCASTWLGFVSSPSLGALATCCMSPFPVGSLVASILLRNRTAIALSLLAIAITFCGNQASYYGYRLF